MIVVGIDGSEQSYRALVWAVEHAIGRSSTVQAVMAVQTKDADDATRRTRLVQAQRTVERMVDDVLATVAQAPTVTYEIVEGDPTVVMVDASRHADLLVFGAHRMTSIRQTALGTVSAACIRMGACPVLVIPVGMPEASQTEPSADLVLA